MDILWRLKEMESECLRIENRVKQQLETVRSAMKLVREECLSTFRDRLPAHEAGNKRVS